MNLVRTSIQWCAPLGLIALGVLYLNSALYSAWISGGPPNNYSIAWAHRALVHFGFSLSFLFSGPMVFAALKNGLNFWRSKYKYAWFLVVFVSLAYPQAKEYFLIDSCLDRGGQWNELHFECKK
jgi:hypothetical protein